MTRFLSISCGPLLAAALPLWAALVPSTASGHARLLTPTPRNASSALKLPECGNVARTANSTKFEQGQTLTVSWEETVEHPGCFIVDVSPAGDTNWRQLQIFPDDATGALPHPFTKQVTLPADLVCDQCTLRLRQIMRSGTPCPPANLNPTVDVYYSCADITITATKVPDDLAMPPPSDMAAPAPDLTVLVPTETGGAQPTGCTFGPVAAAPSALVLLLGPAALLLRRRRRS